MTRRGLTRRTVLKLGASAALLPLAGCGDGRENTPWDEGTCDPGTAQDGGVEWTQDPAVVASSEETFPLGVQAGAMTATGALVWGFASDATAKTLRVWRGAGAERRLVVEREVAAADGYLKAPLEGLAANTLYEYAFFSTDGASRSTIGRFRTAFDGDCRRAVTVGATTCTSPANAPFRSLEAFAQRDVDVFCHLGDMTYNDGAASRDEFRAKWRKNLADPGYRGMLPRAGMYVTWDDHEFVNSEKLYTASKELLTTAKDAFFETLPVPRPANDRLWTSYKWGRSVEFFVLDCRLERRPETAPGPDATYVSREQLDWLKDGLAKSDAHFKVVLNSVPMIDWPDAVWLLEGDRWEGYKAQRTELLTHIDAQRIRNVWFLSGDFHVGAVGRLDREGPAYAMREILVGPGANFNPLWLVYKASEQDAEAVAPPSQFDYFSGELAATFLTFDPERDAVRVEFVGIEGTVLFDRWLQHGQPT